MIELIWMLITTAIGFAIGIHTGHPYAGGAIGFGLGALALLSVKTGCGAIFEALGDILGALF